MSDADGPDRVKCPFAERSSQINGRRIVSEFIIVIRNGLRWRDAPARVWSHKTICDRFIRWSRLGVISKIFAALAAKGGKLDQLMINTYAF